MHDHPEYVETLWDNAKYFKEELQKPALIQVYLKHQSHQ